MDCNPNVDGLIITCMLLASLVTWGITFTYFKFKND